MARDNFGYKILKEYPMDFIMSKLKDDKKSFYDSDLEKRVSLSRMDVFYEKGCDCVSCVRKGSYFAYGIDKGGGAHLDLYGKDPVESSE